MQKTRGMSLATINTGTKMDDYLKLQRGVGEYQPVSSVIGNIWTAGKTGGFTLEGDQSVALGSYIYNYLGLGRRRAQDEMYLQAMSNPAEYLSNKERAVQESVLGLAGQMTADLNEYLRLGYGEEAALKAALKRTEQRYTLEEQRINKMFPSGLTSEKVKAIAASKPVSNYGGAKIVQPLEGAKEGGEGN